MITTLGEALFKFQQLSHKESMQLNSCPNIWIIIFSSIGERESKNLMTSNSNLQQGIEFCSLLYPCSIISTTRTESIEIAIRLKFVQKIYRSVGYVHIIPSLNKKTTPVINLKQCNLNSELINKTQKIVNR